MGGGMGRGGQKDRLAKADATARIRGSTSQVGGGEDLFLDLSEQEDEQGLREAMRKCRSVHLRGHDPFDGEASSAWLRISKQFRKVDSAKSNFRFAEFSEVQVQGVRGFLAPAADRFARRPPPQLWQR